MQDKYLCGGRAGEIVRAFLGEVNDAGCRDRETATDLRRWREVLLSIRVRSA